MSSELNDLRFKAALPFLFSTKPALPQEEVRQGLLNPMSAQALQYLYAGGGLCCDHLASKMQGPSSAEHRRRAAVRNIFFLVYVTDLGGIIRPDVMESLCRDAVGTMYNSMLSGINNIDGILETEESRRLFLDMVKGYFLVAFDVGGLSFESDFRFFPLLSQYLRCSLSFHNEVGTLLNEILTPESFVSLGLKLLSRDNHNVHFAFACFYSFCCFQDSPEYSSNVEHLNQKISIFTFTFPALQTVFSTSSGRLPIVFPQLIDACISILNDINHLNFLGDLVLPNSFSRILPSLLDLNVVDSNTKRLTADTFKIAAQLLSSTAFSPSDPSLISLLPKALEIIVDSSHLPAMLNNRCSTYMLTEGAFNFVSLLLADPATRRRFPRLVMQSGVNFPSFVRSLRSMTQKVFSQAPSPSELERKPVFALTPRWIEFFSSLLFVCGTPADHDYLRRLGWTYEIYPYCHVFCPITNGDFLQYTIPWLSSIAGGHYICAAINRPSIRPTFEPLPQSFHGNMNFLDVAATHANFVSKELQATETPRLFSALELSVWADHLRNLHRVCRAIFLLLQPDKRGVQALRRMGVSEEGARRRFGVDLRKPQTPAGLGAGSRLNEFKLRAEAERMMKLLQRVQGEIAQYTRENESWIR